VSLAPPAFACLAAAVLAAGAPPAFAQPVTQPPSGVAPVVKPPARIGTDDDSVRPMDKRVRPQAQPRLLPPKQSKGRGGTDDDSVRPLPRTTEPRR
jgi:hypothetical protein